MTNRTLVLDVEPPNNSEPQIRQLPTPKKPGDARIIALVLASMGVQSSLKGVVRVLMEFSHCLILPGQEVRRPPVKIRTVSNVTQSTVGLLRSVSSNRNRTILIGSCCFTQTAKSPISGGGTLSAVGTSNQAAALHARRFTTIARDPSIAIVSPNLSAAGNNNESVNITEGQKQLLLV
ncbi:hypothetical protein BY996DRAFT_6416523 [Phakopsora pachyrhizi]|nr:hypothetical protein BY996DRAFT_6416523 [Phakopsora pachyrhizi]